MQTAANQTLLNANYKCQFKAFTQIIDSEDQKIDGIPISFNNFKDGITRTSLKENDEYKLFITIPEGSFGVIMFYKKTVTGSNTITLTINSDGQMEQINCKEPISTTSLSLKTDGIYILKLDKTVTDINIETSENGRSNLFFSNLDIIPEDSKLNPQLGLTDDNDYTAVINKIKEYDSSNKFYYNYITDSSTLINFNDEDTTETLMTSDI